MGGGIDGAYTKPVLMATRAFSIWNAMMTGCGSTTTGRIQTTGGILATRLFSVSAIISFRV